MQERNTMREYGVRGGHDYEEAIILIILIKFEWPHQHQLTLTKPRLGPNGLSAMLLKDTWCCRKAWESHPSSSPHQLVVKLSYSISLGCTHDNSN